MHFVVFRELELLAKDCALWYATVWDPSVYEPHFYHRPPVMPATWSSEASPASDFAAEAVFPIAPAAFA